ncbi:MAG TPA: hypothetical protein VHR45_23520 [Thermoanaerobaculia bacterium]|nr:hypothetical protein [Thermoanaerobaculia bacterium]
MKIAGLILTFASSLLLPGGSLLAQGVERGEPPPWAVESPAAAGAPFALGLDYVYDREDGLRISSATSVVTLRDLASGRTDTSTISSDPSLLNRKFDIRWTATGEGAQIPIALPQLRLAGVGIDPTLVLQAASTALTLRFFDKPEPADSTALSGRASIFGMGLTLTAPLCRRRCPWFATAGYRFSELRPFAAGRSPAFAAAGFTVLEDQTRLRLRRDEGLLRIGRSLAAGRVALYLGWLRRRDLLRDDDTLLLRSEQVAEETLLTSSTRLGATTTAGLAGLEARLAPPLLVRIETIFGGRHLAVALKVAYLRLPARRPGVTIVHPSKEEERRRTAAKLAQSLVEALPGILERFQAQRRKLLAEGGGDAYPKDGIAALLDSTESELVRELKEEDLAPVRDYVGEVFQQARSDLGLSPRTARRRSSTPRVALASLRAVADEPPPSRPRGLADPVLDGLEAFMKGLYERATKNDLIVDLCVVSEPEGARVTIYSKDGTKIDPVETTGPMESVFRGRYFYTVEKKDFTTIKCDATSEATSQCTRINLWVKRQPKFTCDLKQATCVVPEGRWPDACLRR